MKPFSDYYIDELIDIRKDVRTNKDWKLSDEIRDYLDSRLVFIFDAPFGQDVHFLVDRSFKSKDKRLETIGMSNRQYVEFIIKQDIRAESNFNAWLYSINKNKAI